MDFATYQNLIEQNKSRRCDSLVARFYDRPVKTEDFDANGMPVFKTVCYCEIRIKDNTTEVFDQPATEEKIARFPVEYARYQLSRKQIENGTPLEQFAFLTLSEIEACKYRGIFTIEALADLSDSHARDLGITEERLLAQRFLAGNRKIKQALDTEKLITEYQQKIAALETEITRFRQNKNTSRRNKR